MGVEVDTGRDEDAEDQDKEHDLIEKCPPAQHSASLALQPVRIHYNTLPKVKKAGGAAWDPGGAEGPTAESAGLRRRKALSTSG